MHLHGLGCELLCFLSVFTNNCNDVIFWEHVLLEWWKWWCHQTYTLEAESVRFKNNIRWTMLPHGFFHKKMVFLIKQCLDEKQQYNFLIVGQRYIALVSVPVISRETPFVHLALHDASVLLHLDSLPPLKNSCIVLSLHTSPTNLSPPVITLW